MRLILILTLFLFGFSAPKESEKELQEITAEFYKIFPNAPKREVSFTSAKGLPLISEPGTGKVRRAHGICYIGPKSVEINLDWWKETTNIWYKRKVVFHELGHCSLNLSHPKNPLEKTIMNNILNTVTPDGSNWNVLVEELKRRK